MTQTIDQEYVSTTLQQLVQINSTNPTLAVGNAGEAQIAAHIAGLLEQLGLDISLHEIKPGRPNVIGILRGSGRGRCLLINGHMDTVGVDGMADPFSGEIRDGKLYGRGAQDMKASLAAMLGAAKALVDNNNRPAGDLILAFVVDEEMLSIGTADLVKHVRADAAIVTEPTDLTICRAHRGFIWYEIETVGRAAHGSRYLEGIDANMHMGRFLADLDRLEKELRQRPPHPLAGPPSLHASKIQGGSEISVYAANCLLQIERRTIPGETVPQATAELQAIIDRLAAEDPTFKATLKATFDRDPFEISSNAPVVQSLERVTSTHLGHAPQHSGQTFWTDAALLAGAGIDTVLIGPIGAGLHSAEEWVDLQSVYALTAILADTAVDFCN